MSLGAAARRSPLAAYRLPHVRHGCKPSATRQLTGKFISVFIRTFFLLARLGDFILLLPFDGSRPVDANNMLITILSEVFAGPNGGRYFIAAKLLIGPIFPVELAL